MRPNLIKRLVVFCAVAAVAMLVAVAPALAGLEVDPIECNFGDVEVGSTATAIITAQNTGFIAITIDSIVLVGPSDFALLASPEGTTLGEGESADIEVGFTPTVLGYASATLQVSWTNGEAGTSFVELTGTGVAATSSPVDDLLAEFDEWVAEGALVGSGSGNSADGRLGALRNMIVVAGDYLDQGEVALAVAQMEAVLARCDGEPRPPDFVEGDATETLYYMVGEVIAACETSGGR